MDTIFYIKSIQSRKIQYIIIRKNDQNIILTKPGKASEYIRTSEVTITDISDWDTSIYKNYDKTLVFEFINKEDSTALRNIINKTGFFEVDIL